MRDPLNVAYADLGDRGIECFQQALRTRGALHLVGEFAIRRDHDARPNRDILFDSQRSDLGVETCRHINAFCDRCNQPWAWVSKERQKHILDSHWRFSENSRNLGQSQRCPFDAGQTLLDSVYVITMSNRTVARSARLALARSILRRASACCRQKRVIRRSRHCGAVVHRRTCIDRYSDWRLVKRAFSEW